MRAILNRRPWNRTITSRLIVGAVTIALASVLGGCAGSPSILNTHSGYADRTATLSWVLFGIATLVFIIVTVLVTIAILRGRGHDEEEPVRNGPRAEDRRTILLVLVSGAVIPAVVLVALMLIGISIEQAEAAANSTLTVEVVGHRWWWEVRYPQQGITTANEIHIPAGQAVTVKLTTGDVIHSFWVPQLHGKIDLIPGQTNTISLEADSPGVYEGQCAEFCGLQHANMRFLVIADDDAAFERWVMRQQRPAPQVVDAVDSLVFEGQQAFLGSACVYCHTIRGTSASGFIGPDLTHIASRRTIGAGILENTPGNLAGWIVNSQALKPGNLMPPMNLDASQVQAIIAYLETLE